MWPRAFDAGAALPLSGERRERVIIQGGSPEPGDFYRLLISCSSDSQVIAHHRTRAESRRLHGTKERTATFLRGVDIKATVRIRDTCVTVSPNCYSAVRDIYT